MGFIGDLYGIYRGFIWDIMGITLLNIGSYGK